MRNGRSQLCVLLFDRHPRNKLAQSAGAFVINPVSRGKGQRQFKILRYTDIRADQQRNPGRKGNGFARLLQLNLQREDNLIAVTEVLDPECREPGWCRPKHFDIRDVLRSAPVDFRRKTNLSR